MSEIGDWFKSVPLITRTWFGLSVFFPIAARFGILDWSYLVLLSQKFLWEFQIWRPITALCFYPMGFAYLMNLYFLYNYSRRLEEGVFSGRPGDYVFLLLFAWICCTIIALFVGMMLLMDSMVMVILYIWCQLNQDTIVMFWFGTQFKAKYIPWVLLIFRLVMGGDVINELVGILVGHLYFFLKFKYPVDFGGPALLNTPEILYRYFPNQRMFGGFGQAPSRRNVPEGGGGANEGRHNWGRGNILGRD